MAYKKILTLILALSLTTSMFSAVVSEAQAKPVNGNGGGPGEGKSDQVYLEVSLSEGPTQAVVVGTSQHIFTQLVLDASALTQDIKVDELNFTVKTQYKASPSDVANFKIYDGNTQLAVTNNPDSDTGAKITDGETATVTFTLANPLNISSGTTKILSVKADVSSSAEPISLYQVGIAKPEKRSKIQVVDASYYYGGKLNINYQYSNGTEIYFNSAGNLFLATSLYNNDTGLIPSITNGVTLGVITVEASGEDIALEELYVTAASINGGGWDQIKNLYIYANGALIGSTTTNQTSGDKVLVDMSNNPYIIAKDTNVNLYFKAETASVSTSINGNVNSFGGIQIYINSGFDVIGTGLSSGNRVSISIPQFKPSSNVQYIVKSMPVVATNDLLSNGIDGGIIFTGTELRKELYRLSIGVNGWTDIGLGKLTFRVTHDNVGVSNFRLIDSFAGTEIATTTAFNVSDNVSLIEFNNLNYQVSPSSTPRLLTVQADVSCLPSDNCGFNTSSDLTIRLLGDFNFESYLFPAPLSNIGGHFAWTDFWLTPYDKFSDPNVYTSTQWSNSYLVPLVSGATMSGNMSDTVYFYR